MIFQPLVNLDAAFDLILCFAFFPSELNAVDATVPDVDEIQVIDKATKKAGAAGRVRADPVALEWEKLLVGPCLK